MVLKAVNLKRQSCVHERSEGGELEEAELLARMERWGEGGETTTRYI
jgi:hypothetical protein